MSVPSPYSQRGASADTREDCRDYLRTGRCKYGASCKYYHPPNVQSGGGMKAPVDPSEPMFPIRPNEPPCQYYMKHGTCKFGQACKFHHPPQSSVTAALVGGGAVVMNVGRKNDTPQIIMNSIPGDGSSNGTPMMLQFLPQRPEEQDCIFFLKNGRCKYGATCRYHHPINFSQRRQDDGRRQRVQAQQVPEGYLQHANVQFISHSGASHVNYQQGPSSSTSGAHMLIADGNVAYMTVDGPSGKGSYHPMSVVSKDGYCAPTGAPISHNQDHTSSTSSIASFDTANSNLDHLVPHTEQSSGLWNRQKNNGSHASLNAYDSSNGRQRIAMSQSMSDGNMASRRHRAASYGSASDSGGYVDASGSMAARQAQSGSSMTTTGSSGSMPTWRTERTPSSDGGRRSSSSQYRSSNIHDDVQEQSHGQGHNSAHNHGRRPPGGRRRSSEAVDDGLSMMTSALLTMLDTPEEAAAEGYEYDYDDFDQHGGGHLHGGGRLPPSRMPMMAAMRGDMSVPSQQRNGVARVSSDGRAYHHDEGGQRLDYFGVESQYQDQHALGSEVSSNWLPSWQAPKSVVRSLEDAQSMSVMQPRHGPPNSPQHSSNVGLFLS